MVLAVFLFTELYAICNNCALIPVRSFVNNSIKILKPLNNYYFYQPNNKIFIMKKVMLCLSAVCLIAFMSCKDDATKKIDDSNVAEAAERDATASKFPVIEFDKVEHDFGEIEAKTPVETIFTYKNREQYKIR